MINIFIKNAQCIAKFQLIEAYLKMALVKYEIAQDELNSQIKDAYSVSDLIDISYGLLLRRYKKVSIDESLYGKLVILKDYRNYLAHQSFLAGLDMPAEMKLFMGVNPVVIDYIELNNELDECIAKLIGEYKQVFSSAGYN